MNHCKHKGCKQYALEGSVYCSEHQLIVGKVRQRTRGPGNPSKTGSTDWSRKDSSGSRNNPKNSGGGKGAAGPSRGGKR
jgi:hypothetical protein